MAKIILPLMSGQASGKFGDIVFMRRGGQNVARIRVSPANPNTPLQQAARENLSSLSRIYNEVGALQEDGVTPVSYPVNRVDKSVQPPTITEVQENVLTQGERDSWASPQEFISLNARRLFDNQPVVRTKPGA